MQLTADDVMDLAKARERQFSDDFFRWQKLAKVLDGKHAEVMPSEFLAGGADRPVGFIRRGWRSVSNIIGKVPDIAFAPTSLKSVDQDDADRLEKICFYYNDIWGMKRKMKVLAALASGFGAAGVTVIPDPAKRNPMLAIEDPRNVLPGPSWSATSRGTNISSFIQTPQWPELLHADPGHLLDNCIIRKYFTGYQIRELFGSVGDEIVQKDRRDLSEVHTVYLFSDCYEFKWIHMSSGKELSQSYHALGVCPTQYYSLYTMGNNTSTSDFEQQIGLEVAFMRILNQKLELNDGVAFPWMKKRGWVEIDPEEREITLGGPDSDADFLSPPATFQVDRDLMMVRDILRLNNFETETSMGETSGGPITGRGVVELDQIRIATAQAYFDDFSYLLARVYATALMIDRLHFPNEHKNVSGWGHGEPFLLDYTPGTDIPEQFGRCSIEFGPGLGGFEGHLQMLQDLGADAIPLDDVMRKNPHIRSITDAKRKILMEKIEKTFIESGLSGQLAVPLDWLAQFRTAVSAGDDPFKWVVDNPPAQPTATPENTGPVAPGALPPELAGALAGAGGGVSAPGSPGHETTVYAPPLSQLLSG